MEWEFGSYLVRHHARNPERLIVVFTGAGRAAEEERIEEFGNTLSRIDASLCFVQDRAPGWFNHDTTPAMTDHVAELASGYSQVGAMGESMGASSAIAFAGHCPKVGRLLAFAPQFGMSEPFIRFDKRFRRFGEANPDQSRRTFDVYGRPPQNLVLYGTEEVLDLVHAGLYAVYGYDVGFFDGADHPVAAQLRNHARGNLLFRLVARFADFSLPFGYKAAAKILGDAVSRHVVSRDHGFDADRLWRARSQAAAESPQRPPAPEGLADIASGRATDQSSVSAWSRGTTAVESARAISGRLTGGFSFHTDDEDQPWWSIDFGEEVVVRLVRIFNRMGSLEVSKQGLQFAIEVSDDGSNWREAHRKTNLKLFGGADGQPYVWAPEEGVPARRLRIRLLGRGAMHYDQIEIFG